jgi:hypothetical protein
LKKFRFLGIRQVGLRRSLRQVELGDTDKGPGSGIERWQKVELKKERRVWRRKGLKRRAVVDLEEDSLVLRPPRWSNLSECVCFYRRVLPAMELFSRRAS